MKRGLGSATNSPGQELAQNLQSIVLDARENVGSVSEGAALVDDRQQTGADGRKRGGDLGRVVVTFNALTRQVHEVVKRLGEAEQVGGATIEPANLITATSDTFNERSLDLLAFGEDAVDKFAGKQAPPGWEKPKRGEWERDLYVLRSAVRTRKLRYDEVGFVHVPKCHDIAHTITELVDKFAQLQGKLQDSGERMTELDATIALSVRKRPSSQRLGSWALKEKISDAFNNFDTARGDSAKRARITVGEKLYNTISVVYSRWIGEEAVGGQDSLAEAVMVGEGVADDIFYLLKQVDQDRCAILGAITPLLSKPNFYKEVLNITGVGFLREFLNVQVGEESLSWTEDEADNYNERIQELFGNNIDSLRDIFSNANAHKLVVQREMEASRGKLPDVEVFSKNELMFRRTSEMWRLLDDGFKRRSVPQWENIQSVVYHEVEDNSVVQKLDAPLVNHFPTDVFLKLLKLLNYYNPASDFIPRTISLTLDEKCGKFEIGTHFTFSSFDPSLLRQRSGYGT